jgi:protease I
MSDAAPRILMVIAPKDFRDEELLAPRTAFQAVDWPVDTVSTQTGTAIGMLGATETITQTLDTVDPTEYRAVVVVGGMGSIEYLWHNKTLHSILNVINTQGGVIAGICLSAAVPALAGLAKGKQLTVYETPESVAAITNNGGTYTNEALTVDGRLITANGPEAAEAFGAAIVSALQPLVIPVLA